MDSRLADTYISGKSGRWCISTVCCCCCQTAKGRVVESAVPYLPLKRAHGSSATGGRVREPTQHKVFLDASPAFINPTVATLHDAGLFARGHWSSVPLPGAI